MNVGGKGADGGGSSRLFMGLYVWTTVWNSQDSISVHQSNTALHIQPQEQLGGISECTQTVLQDFESNERGPRRSFRF